MRDEGEICEGYVRDKNDPSRSESPLYKGNSSDDVRDGDFSDKVHSIFFPSLFYLLNRKLAKILHGVNFFYLFPCVEAQILMQK